MAQEPLRIVVIGVGYAGLLATVVNADIWSASLRVLNIPYKLSHNLIE